MAVPISDKLRKCNRRPSCVIKYSVVEQATSKRRGQSPGIFTTRSYLDASHKTPYVSKSAHKACF